MAPVQQALDRFLRAHEPYPAVILDRHYNLISANDAVSTLTDGVAPDLLEPPANALRVTLHPAGMAPRILNMREWSAHLLHRLRRQARSRATRSSSSSTTSFRATRGCAVEAPHDELAGTAIVLPLRMRGGERELAFFSTVSTFGTAVEITLAELMIEAFYPANAATASPSPRGHRRPVSRRCPNRG